MDVEKSVVVESPAFKLESKNGVGDPTIRKISWKELRESLIGTVWETKGDGNLFSEINTATLVFRNVEIAVVYHLRSQTIEQHGDPPTVEVDEKLVCYRFI
ncbi:MAG: hypothetical protein ACOCQD_03740 [archaeon]